MYTIKKYDGKTQELLVNRELQTSPQVFMDETEREFPLVTYEYPDNNTIRLKVWKYLALAMFRPSYVFELIRN